MSGEKKKKPVWDMSLQELGELSDQVTKQATADNFHNPSPGLRELAKMIYEISDTDREGSPRKHKTYEELEKADPASFAKHNAFVAHAMAFVDIANR